MHLSYPPTPPSTSHFESQPECVVLGRHHKVLRVGITNLHNIIKGQKRFQVDKKTLTIALMQSLAPIAFLWPHLHINSLQQMNEERRVHMRLASWWGKRNETCSCAPFRKYASHILAIIITHLKTGKFLAIIIAP